MNEKKRSVRKNRDTKKETRKYKRENEKREKIVTAGSDVNEKRREQCEKRVKEMRRKTRNVTMPKEKVTRGRI